MQPKSPTATKKHFSHIRGFVNASLLTDTQNKNTSVEISDGTSEVERWAL